MSRQDKLKHIRQTLRDGMIVPWDDTIWMLEELEEVETDRCRPDPPEIQNRHPNAPPARTLMTNPLPRAFVPDEKVREFWRAVNGPRAQINGPILAFAAILSAYVGGRYEQRPQIEAAEEQRNELEDM